MGFDDTNNFSWLVRPHEKTLEFYREYKDKGFRLCSLSISGDVPFGGMGEPRYSAVMIKSIIRYETKSFFRRTQGEFQEKFEEMAAQGFGPYIVAAAGPKNDAVFGGSFREMDKIPLTKLNISAEDFLDTDFDEAKKGNMLIWADCFGTFDDRRYCAIWGPNPRRYAWTLAPLEIQGDDKKQFYDAMMSVGARPYLAATAPVTGMLLAFNDSRIGKWSSRSDYSFDETTAYRTQKKADGLYPLRISASGSGDSTRFSIICTEGEIIHDRNFRMTGRGSIVSMPKLTQLHQYMEDFIKRQNMRGMALAITKGTRLVFTCGYTFAEAEYPDVTPHTMFRQASVSKLYCALAIWRLIGEEVPNKISLDTLMQSILKLKRAGGKVPNDIRMMAVTIRHLLESCSGIDQDTVRNALSGWRATDGLPQPMTDGQMCSEIAGRPMVRTPGKWTDYGRTDYYLLGRVAAKRMGVASFAEALKLLVLDPLGMTHTFNARTHENQRRDGEARHHLTVLSTGGAVERRHLQTSLSIISDDRHIVPFQYGGENMEIYSSAGGLTSSVVDMARIGAALTATKKDTPLFRSSTLVNLLHHAAEATADPKGSGGSQKGYYGFDGCTELGSDYNRIYDFEKGGLLHGARTRIQGFSDGFTYSLACNGDYVSQQPWLQTIRGLTAEIDTLTGWGSKDLFPDYGMSSF